MQLTDPAEIRALLSADRAWAVYALGDLAPGLAEHAEWHCASGPLQSPALILLFRAFPIPVLYTQGPPEALAPLLDTIRDRAMYLSIRPDVLPLLQARGRISHQMAMWRMILRPERFQPPSLDGLRRLTLADLPALEALYADGRAAGEAPDFFAPYMLEQGVFYGLWDGPDLAASAGTHIVAPADRVAAVGNVYTRRDWRGQGLAARVTGAVTAELLSTLAPPAVIALNVSQANPAAQRVYQRLGFERYCDFYEGLAERNDAPHA